MGFSILGMVLKLYLIKQQPKKHEYPERGHLPSSASLDAKQGIHSYLEL